MVEREQKRRVAADRVDEDVEADEATAPAVSDRSQRLKGELDDLLDEIAGVLETNAEDFVKRYIQKGGE